MTKGLRRFPFTQLDVFSSLPFEGNQLAVFHDGRELTDEQMQSIAREMNLAETVFILPRDSQIERERGVRARIFTVQEELPFAGHPTLGTAFFLRGTSGASEVCLELNVGKVPVRFEETDSAAVLGEMTQMDPTFGAVHDPQAVARACGLKDGDIDLDLPIQTISTGVPFTIVPLRGLDVTHQLQIDVRGSIEYLNRIGGKFFYFVSRETQDHSARLHARMKFYNSEDPATGSAAGCASAWMVANGVAQADERVMIEQGIEIKRPSRIFVRAGLLGNRVVNVRVGGNVVEVLRGELFF
jgi:trans-2,3-dihydro-3-hydroxyanthranilate isomerase